MDEKQKDININKSLVRILNGKDFYETRKKIPVIDDSCLYEDNSGIIAEEFLDPLKSGYYVKISENADVKRLKQSQLMQKEDDESFAYLPSAIETDGDIKIYYNGEVEVHNK